MYSSSTYRFSACVVLLSILSGCAWINDKPKAQQTINSATLDLSCLNGLPNQLQILFDGGYSFEEQDQQELDRIWTCLDKALFTFSRHTTGAREGVYTSKELQGFANRYLPSSTVLNGGLTDGIFKLKRAVLGGTDTEITQDEIQSLRKKLTTFGAIIKPFSGHLNVLVHADGKTDAEKRAASESLNEFVMDLADLLGDSVNPVSWNDLMLFVSELDRFTRLDKPTALTAVKEQLPLFQYFKLLIVGGNETAIERAKWRPIFQAVSHLYNALFITSNTSELLEALSIEIDSTEIEQKKAVDKITGLLKVLKSDPNLYAKRTIDVLADSWGKVLVLNSFLFPRSQGSLALKPFLGSTTLRKLAGYIVDQAMKLKANQMDSLLVQSLADNAVTLVEQAAIANSTQLGTMTPFSFSTFKDYLPQVKPLLKDSKMYDLVLQGTDALKSATPILIGKESDALTPKDLRAIIQKSADIFLIWNTSKNIEESIAQSIEVLLRNPSFYSIQVTQIDQVIDSAHTLIGMTNVQKNIPWDRISTYIHNGLKAKSVFFANSEKSISSYELKQLANLWEPFRKGIDPEKGLADALAEAANVLKNSPFSSAKIEAIVPAIDTFLPPNQSIEKLGFNYEQLGLLKAILVGGSNNSIERNEYTDLARISSALVKTVYPILKNLPKDYKMGLNSQTMTLAESGLQAMIDARATSSRGFISLIDLKKFSLSYLIQKGYPIQEKTLDTLLIGVNHRVLQGKKTPKPASLSGTISMEQLKPILNLISQLKVAFADIENAFQNVPNTEALEQKQILSKLTLNETKMLLTKIQPIMKGGSGLPYFTAPGRKNTAYYQEDLSYKAFLYRVLSWAFPAYKLAPDTATGEAALRLAYSDVVDILNDINDVVGELKMSYGVNPPEVSAKKRMQTVNIFTQIGNGDDYLDILETTEFLTMASSGKALLDKTVLALAKECGINVKTVEEIQGFSISCLKSKFFSSEFFARTYGPIAPQMTEEYIALNAEDKSSFQDAVLTATLAGWNEKTIMTLSDMETLVSVPYYAENIFEKMDLNSDGTLNFSEAMSGFPVFCNEIKKAAGTSIKGSCAPGEYPGQIEAVYGHLLFKGAPPRGIKPGDSIWTKIREAKNFLVWVRYWNRLNRDPEIRDSEPPQLKRHDLLSIISNLSSSMSPALESQP